MQHWLPYDEERLLRLLRVDRETCGGTCATTGARSRNSPPVGAGRTRSASRRRSWPSPADGFPSTSLLLVSLSGRCAPSPRGTSHSTSCSTPCTRMRSPTTRGGRSASQHRRAPAAAPTRHLGPLQVARMNGLLPRTRGAKVARAGAARARRGGRDATARLSPSGRPVCSSRDSCGSCRAGWSESHYNGPPRTDRTGRLQRSPRVPAWAAPAISADGFARRRRGVRAEAAARSCSAERSASCRWTAAGGRRGGSATGESGARRASRIPPTTPPSPATGAASPSRPRPATSTSPSAMATPRSPWPTWRAVERDWWGAHPGAPRPDRLRTRDLR